MVRTIISFDEDDKEWLERAAAEEGVSMAAMVRRAVKAMRSAGGTEPPSTVDLLEATSGIRSGADGLVTQERLRDEWTR